MKDREALNGCLQLVLLGVAFVVFIKWNTDRKDRDMAERAAADVAACKADPECQDSEAISKSMYAKGAVRSTTGRSYFRGVLCTSNCEGTIAGYQWAEQNRVDEPWDCGGDSVSFRKGCHAYLEEQ